MINKERKELTRKKSIIVEMSTSLLEFESTLQVLTKSIIELMRVEGF